MENITPEQFMELYDRISKLAEQHTAKALSERKEPKYRSDDINELAAAMATAQGSYPTIPKNKLNSHTKEPYADLDMTLKYIRPILSANGVFLSQYTSIDVDGVMLLHSVICHKSGQWAASRDRIYCKKEDLDAFKSEMDTRRRIQAEDLLGITSGDENDGESAMHGLRHEFSKGTAINHDVDGHKQAYETINKHQYDELVKELSGWPDLAEDLMFKQKISNLADLRKDNYAVCITQIRENKKVRKNPNN